MGPFTAAVRGILKDSRLRAKGPKSDARLVSDIRAQVCDDGYSIIVFAVQLRFSNVFPIHYY